MSRRPLPFKETDVTRLVKAVEKAGVSVRRVEYANGKIIVIADTSGGDGPANEWDSVK